MVNYQQKECFHRYTHCKPLDMYRSILFLSLILLPLAKNINIIMKKTILGILFIASLNIYAQENLKFEKVIQSDSIAKSLLFTSINDWFATTYNSANDVIQMSDKDAGTIIGNGSMDYSKKGMSYGCYSGYITYTIKVYVRENRFKVVLTNFNHSVKVGNSSLCSFGTLTTADVYATKGMSKKWHNKVWSDMKITVEEYSNGIFKSLEKKTTNIKLEEEDNW